MSFVSPFIADIMLWLMYIAIVVAVIVTIVSMARTVRLRTKDEEVVNGVPRTRMAWIVIVAFLLILPDAPVAINYFFPILADHFKEVAAAVVGHGYGRFPIVIHLAMAG